MASIEHEQASGARRVPCAVLTISDTRTAADDHSGDAIVAQLEAGGYPIVARDLVPDEPSRIDAALRAWIADPAVAAILATGGTGVAPRDTTIEVADRLIEKPLPGFGELFRALSFEAIGPAAMLSRATGGVAAGATVVFCMPGSTNAVELAMSRLVVPQLRHIAWSLRPAPAPRDPR